MDKAEIKFNFVYSNADGESRLVVSVSPPSGSLNRCPSLVTWRTSNPELNPTQKSHGSCTVEAFAKWAVNRRAATDQDRAAFETVENRRRWRSSDKKAVALIRRRMQLGTAA